MNFRDYIIEKIKRYQLGDKTKEMIAKDISDTGRLGKLYWFELSLAAIIATLGLLQNSIPVVIGVMLIAPLMRPIQALSFSIITAHHIRTWKNFRNIFLSVLLVIFLSFLITKIIPIKLEGSEVLARTQPNVLDFFIALTSAFIAFLALLYKEKLSSSIAGVSMAASLLPPLSVVGIEIAYHNYFLSWNAFLLFVANLIAIVFTGIFLFALFGFKPHQEDDKLFFKKNILFLFLTTSIISLPLISSIVNLNRQVKINIFLNDYFKNNLRIEKINIQKDDKFDLITINGEYTKIDNIQDKLKDIKKEYKNKFKKKVKLKLELKKIKEIET